MTPAVRRLAAILGAALTMAATAVTAQAFTLTVTGPATAPRMVFDNQMKVASVCLPVTNPAAGQSVPYGSPSDGLGSDAGSSRRSASPPGR